MALLGCCGEVRCLAELCSPWSKWGKLLFGLQCDTCVLPFHFQCFPVCFAPSELCRAVCMLPSGRLTQLSEAMVPLLLALAPAADPKPELSSVVP